MISPETLEPAGVERQRSLALAGLVPDRDDQEPGTTFSVLDLGPASRDNVEYFAGSGVRLTVADLYRGVARERRSAELFRRLLRYEPWERFDLVLAWDVLNYLKREELGALVETLAAHLRSGTLVHAFVVTARDMAPEPISYRVADSGTLLCSARKGRPIHAPRYAEPDLLRAMPGLSVDHRFQLRNGMAEYVFTYRARQRVEVSRLSSSAPTPPEITSTPSPPLGQEIRWSPAPSR